MRSYGEESPAEATTTTRVTRSIMIVKPPGYQINGSPPASPAGSTTPGSPFSGKVVICFLLSFFTVYSKKKVWLQSK